jgi:hypothetical protein
MKPVYIEWEDAFSWDKYGWLDDDRLDEIKEQSFIVKQLGFITHEDEHKIVIISRFGVFSDNGEKVSGGVMNIPKPWIKKRVDLTKYEIEFYEEKTND